MPDPTAHNEGLCAEVPGAMKIVGLAEFEERLYVAAEDGLYVLLDGELVMVELRRDD